MAWTKLSEQNMSKALESLEYSRIPNVMICGEKYCGGVANLLLRTAEFGKIGAT
jgi:hypothetical protein